MLNIKMYQHLSLNIRFELIDFIFLSSKIEHYFKYLYFLYYFVYKNQNTNHHCYNLKKLSNLLFIFFLN